MNQDDKFDGRRNVGCGIARCKYLSAKIIIIVKIMLIWAATDSICEWKMNHGIAPAGSYKNTQTAFFCRCHGPIAAIRSR